MNDSLLHSLEAERAILLEKAAQVVASAADQSRDLTADEDAQVLAIMTRAAELGRTDQALKTA